jgi:hypothetical protein
MTDCPNGAVRDALPEYLNDRLDAVRRAEVESHLAVCDACREELSLLRDLRATMRRVPAVNVGAIAGAIPPYHAPARRGWAPSWRAAAAIAAIAVGGTSIALLHDRTSTTARSTQPQVAAAKVPPLDSARPVETATTPAVSPNRRPAPVVAAAPRATQELAMAGATIGELSDGELAALVDGIESFDALPSAEVEGAEQPSVGTPEGI